MEISPKSFRKKKKIKINRYLSNVDTGNYPQLKKFLPSGPTANKT